jgi:pyruvate/2-oxoglutarate dehydrogenase complex dihydrolipoamide dehydrogenase (E3) component
MIKQYDAIIIGAGQAGPSLAIDFAKEGMQTAIIERNLFGGTCINTGCVPSKTLYESAYKANIARNIAPFGIDIDQPVKINMKNVLERKNKIVNYYRNNLEQFLRETKNCDVYKGHARFVDSNTITVNDDLLKSDRIFINVGARPHTPEFLEISGVDYLTSSSIMELDIIPKHLIILGGSYVGLEFAQIFRRLGSEVTIIEKMNRLISKEDEDISDEIKNIFENEKINIFLSSEVESLKKDKGEISLELKQNDKIRTIKGSHLLAAIGRKPNTDDLGLDKIGLKLDRKGYISVDDQLNSSVPGIWALGECNGRGAFTHTSYNDYQIVASNILKKQPKSVKDRILAYNLYIDPPMGRVGQNENELISSKKRVLVAKKEMRTIKRAVIKGETNGFMKIFVDEETKKILGASILGTGGDEIIHIFLDMMYAGADYRILKNAMHIHPTISELIPTMLEDLVPLNK